MDNNTLNEIIRAIRLPFPHTGQVEVRKNLKRFNYLAAGRRWRKTTLFMAIAVEKAMQCHQVVWGAPTFDQVMLGWNEMYAAAGTIADFNKSTAVVKFPSGGKVIFRSLDDPDNARGHTADDVIIDEAADVVEAAWYEVLRPMLIDTNGSAFIGGTPKGRNWFYTESLSAFDRDDTVLFNAPTLGARIVGDEIVRDKNPLENPNIPFSEIVHLFRTLPSRVFRQEIMAEFIDEAGGVFTNVANSIDKDRTENELPEDNPRYNTPDSITYFAGIDLARYNDYTVITVFDDSGRQVYFQRFNLISWEQQIDRIIEVCRTYVPVVTIDATGVGDPVVENLRRKLNAQNLPVHINPVKFTVIEKGNTIDKFAIGLDHGKFRLMDIHAQKAELLSYQYDMTPGGVIRMSSPRGQYDDIVISLALATKPLDSYSTAAGGMIDIDDIWSHYRGSAGHWSTGRPGGITRSW